MKLWDGYHGVEAVVYLNCEMDMKLGLMVSINCGMGLNLALMELCTICGMDMKIIGTQV